MALGLALAASREIVVGDRAMRQGGERWLHAGNTTTFSTASRSGLSVSVASPAISAHYSPPSVAVSRCTIRG
jgi:hypothetical protein